MHGAAWVNLMWTNRESSVLIEMFPYQHNKDTYKVLSNVVRLTPTFIFTHC